MAVSTLRAFDGRRAGLVARLGAWGRLALLATLAWASTATAVGLPSTYPGCDTVNVNVPWGGVVNVDLSTCHFFGLGVVSSAPTHGSATPGDVPPLDSYNYTHNASTPAGGGSDQFVVLDDNSDFITVNVTIAAPVSSIVVSPGTLPTLTAGTPFSQALSSSGGTAPYTYSLEAGPLPPGVSLSAAGVVSGTPTKRGGYSFSVRSQDSLGAFAIRAYSGTVQNPALSISPTSATAVQSAPFSQALAVSGGVAPHTFLLESGSFPAGISISPEGVISGTTAAAPGNYPVSLRVTDASTGPGSYFELESFTLTVSPPPSVSIAVAPASVNEDGATPLVYTVTRSLNLSSATVVNITTGGTATSGTDFTGSVPSVSIPAAATSAEITITPTGDIAVEADETVVLTVAAGTGYTVGAPASATGTITNDDQPLTLSPGSLPNGAVAAAYSQALGAAGGVAPYTYAVTAGALPAGLTLSAGGTLAGTPTAGGSFNFTVTATDSAPFPGPNAGSQAYTLVIAAPTILLPATPLAGGTLGAAYSAAISPATGGTAPYSYLVTAGALPGGLTLNTATGAITGTPGALGSFNFSITATDSSTGTGPYTGTQAYAIQVIDNPPVASNSSLTVAYNAAATNAPLTLSGGAAVSVAIATPAANGTAIATGTTITYQPTAGFAGSDSFTYTATNSGGTSAPATVSVTVADPVITITAGGSLAGTVGAAYTQTFTFNGGAQPWSGFQVTNLPAGLSITGTTANSLTVSGTPTQAGSFNLNVSATDSSTGNGPYSVGQAFVLTVAAPSLALAPASTTFTAPYGAAYSQAFTASGGIGPYTYASTGTLPPGLSLSGNTVSGTATAPGSYAFAITATDTGASGTGAPFTVTENYTITVAAPSIAVNPGTLPNPTAGTPYSEIITAAGGVAPYSFAVTAGTLPGGITLAAGGALSGTSNEVGTFNATVTATDANGQSGTRAYTLTIAAPTLTMTPTAGPLSAPYGAAFTQAFTAGGSAGPFTYLLTGALPAGVSFAGNTLSGTPTAPGSYPITVTATDTVLTGAGAPFSIARNYTLDVPAPLIVVSPGTLPGGIAGQAYAGNLSAAGGVAPYTFALTGGALPAGVTLSSTGVLSGTPTASGSFNATVTATDANGQTGASATSLAIAVPALALTPASLPSGTAGAAYSQAFSTSGGIAPYSYAVTAGTLPGGLALSSGGLLSGTPTAAGSSNFTVTVTDATGGTAATLAQAYSLDVVNAPPVAVNDTATVLAGQAVTIPVTANDTSLVPITGIAIVTAPTQGTAVVSGLNIIYTAPTTASPTVSFTYLASGPGGNSAPATVTVTVNPLPVAPSLTASTTPGTPVQVTLNTGAAGGPFTAAAVVAVAPAGAGTATVAASGSNYVLTFTPDIAFSGAAVVRYTLSNAFATSAEATVTVTVLPRPDPSQDVEVRGLIDAQVESTKRFATSQITNFQQRLERLHSGGDGGFDNRLGFAVDQACLDPLVGYAADPCNPDGLGFRGGNGPGNRAMGSTATGRGQGGPIGTWVGGMIRSGSQDGRNGGEDIDFETDGLSAGVDYRVNEAFVIGGGFGYGKDENEVGTQGSRVDGDTQAVAVYASYHPGAIFVDTLLGYQQIDYDLRRYVTANGGTVFGQRDGDQWFASVSVGKDVVREDMMFTPYARLDVAQAELDPFTETGDPIYALRYDAMDVDNSTGNLGLRLDWLREQSWGRFTPQLRMEYQHDFSGRSGAVVRYADLVGGPAYGLSATEFDSNRFMLGLGAVFDLNSGWGWRLEYRGQVGSSGESDNGVGVHVQKQF